MVAAVLTTVRFWLCRHTTEGEDDLRNEVTVAALHIDVPATPALRKDRTVDATKIVTSKFTVEGMTCASCVASIETSLAKMEGVVKVNVALLTSTATVVHDTSAFTPHAVQAAIEGCGFDAFPMVGQEADGVAVASIFRCS